MTTTHTPACDRYLAAAQDDPQFARMVAEFRDLSDDQIRDRILEYRDDDEGTPVGDFMRRLWPLLKASLVLERKAQRDETPQIGNVSITPPIDESYWSYRVMLSGRQAIVGFPKFSTVGIGFAVEEDWNTNLPYTCGTEEIFEHIAHNKGDDSISDDDVRTAIRMVQDAIMTDRLAEAQR